MITVVLFLVALLFILLLWKNKKYLTRSIYDHQENVKNLPGPFCVPFLGYLPLFFTRRRTYDKLARMSQDFGPIFQLKLGVRKVIVVNNLAFIKRTLNEWSFADRPDLPSLKAIQEQDGDFDRFTFMKSNCQWKFYRKNSAKALSLFSSSKNSRLQTLVEQGCRSLWADIRKNGAAGKPYHVKNSVFECVAGIIGAINFGLNFDRDDPLMKEIVGFTERSTEFIKFASFVDYFPACKFFLKHKLEKLQKNGRPVNKLIDQHLKNHHFDPENVGDVADALYKRSSEISDEEYRSLGLTKRHLQRSVMDLFVAGFITVMETFMWSMTCMAKFSDVQEKVQKELDENLRGRFPTVDDRSRTPYTDATILEIFRFSSLTPFSLPHAIAYDAVFEGYYLPKGAVVLPNLWAHHHDPKIFPDPKTFKPERFLDENGQVDVDFSQNVVPFGVGKRRCVGENLARQEVYLLFASTIQKFQISLSDDDAKNLDLDRDVIDGLARMVKPCEFIFHDRYPSQAL